MRTDAVIIMINNVASGIFHIEEKRNKTKSNEN